MCSTQAPNRWRPRLAGGKRHPRPQRETLAPANTPDPNQCTHQLVKNETVDGARLIDNPVYRDRLMKIQGKVMAMRFSELRVLSAPKSRTGSRAAPA